MKKSKPVTILNRYKNKKEEPGQALARITIGILVGVGIGLVVGLVLGFVGHQLYLIFSL